MQVMLQVENLSKAYPNSDFGLQNISFSIPYGSIVGFIGENGAGKSTTIGTIAGTLQKDEGQVYFMGEEINDTNSRLKENIGVVFDSINFSPTLNIKQLSKVLKGVYRQWNQGLFDHYVSGFSLPQQQKIGSFSRGMGMKLSIAVALSHGSRLLMLDEATAGLDPVVRDEILDVLLDFVKDGQHSILLSSHITSDIEKAADFLIFIKKGALIFQVRKDELLNDYMLIEGDMNLLHKLDKQYVIAYQNKGDKVHILVSNKHHLSSTLQTRHFSIDDITLLLMKGNRMF